MKVKTIVVLSACLIVDSCVRCHAQGITEAQGDDIIVLLESIDANAVLLEANTDQLESISYEIQTVGAAISGQIATTNSRLNEVKTKLDTGNANTAAIDAKLATANTTSSAILSDLDHGIDVWEEMRDSLVAMEGTAGVGWQIEDVTEFLNHYRGSGAGARLMQRAFNTGTSTWGDVGTQGGRGWLYHLLGGSTSDFVGGPSSGDDGAIPHMAYTIGSRADTAAVGAETASAMARLRGISNYVQSSWAGIGNPVGGLTINDQTAAIKTSLTQIKALLDAWDLDLNELETISDNTGLINASVSSGLSAANTHLGLLRSEVDGRLAAVDATLSGSGMIRDDVEGIREGLLGFMGTATMDQVLAELITMRNSLSQVEVNTGLEGVLYSILSSINDVVLYMSSMVGFVYDIWEDTAAIDVNVAAMGEDLASCADALTNYSESPLLLDLAAVRASLTDPEQAGVLSYLEEIYGVLAQLELEDLLAKLEQLRSVLLSVDERLITTNTLLGSLNTNTANVVSALNGVGTDVAVIKTAVLGINSEVEQMRVDLTGIRGRLDSWDFIMMLLGDSAGIIIDVLPQMHMNLEEILVLLEESLGAEYQAPELDQPSNTAFLGNVYEEGDETLTESLARRTTDESAPWGGAAALPGALIDAVESAEGAGPPVWEIVIPRSNILAIWALPAGISSDFTIVVDWTFFAPFRVFVHGLMIMTVGLWGMRHVWEELRKYG
jgi:hypothetical protein